jgi:hypothetical protein
VPEETTRRKADAVVFSWKTRRLSANWQLLRDISIGRSGVA